MFKEIPLLGYIGDAQLLIQGNPFIQQTCRGVGPGIIIITGMTTSMITGMIMIMIMVTMMITIIIIIIITRYHDYLYLVL